MHVSHQLRGLPGRPAIAAAQAQLCTACLRPHSPPLLQGGQAQAGPSGHQALPPAKGCPGRSECHSACLPPLSSPRTRWDTAVSA